jgi:hypothetical protein
VFRANNSSFFQQKEAKRLLSSQAAQHYPTCAALRPHDAVAQMPAMHTAALAALRT